MLGGRDLFLLVNWLFLFKGKLLEIFFFNYSVFLGSLIIEFCFFRGFLGDLWVGYIFILVIDLVNE